MAARRRSAYRKPKEPVSARKEQLETCSHLSDTVPETPYRHQEPAAHHRRPEQEGSLPLPVILEILAREYTDSVQGEALCRAALSLAEECGAMEKYRARWDAEETDLTGRLSVLLYDRRQSLELIRYYEKKGNREALQR
ncbi:MAG: hypothetical protein K6T80_06875, partial [Firmicutes bacterium]|nr:hypothetical protein [Bacillota bacterium]